MTAGWGAISAVGRPDAGTAAVQSLLAANQMFFRAIESGDPSLMAAVWKQSPSVSCIHPGWQPVVGWEPVMRTWKALRLAGSSVSVKPIHVLARVVGDGGGVVTALVRFGERHSSSSATGYSEADVTIAMTNVFERMGSASLPDENTRLVNLCLHGSPDDPWRLVSHHATLVEMVAFSRGAAVAESKLWH